MTNRGKEDFCIKYRDEIALSNYSMLKVMSLCVGIVSIFTFVAGGFFDYTRTGLIFYAGWFLVSIIMWGACRGKEKWVKRHVIACFYAYLTILLILSTINGTYVNKGGISVVVLGLILIIPTIVLDRPRRLHTYQAAACIFFCAASLISKPFVLVIVDCFNAVGFSILAIVIGNLLVKMKLSEISSRAEIIRQRDTDMLTGLYNRQAVEEKIRASLLENKTKAALLLIDIDYFKRINDKLGHQYGDKVLKEMAERIRSIFSDTDYMARWGGDEFLVFVPKIQKLEEIHVFARRLNVEFFRKIEYKGTDLELSSSIGAAIFDGTQTLEELFANADKALYRVKYRGRNSYAIYDKE